MKKGFTLIEMLVVIAIIGILAGIVVPLSGDALRTSRETTCRNNLKNLHAAAVNHANDKDGKLPRAGSFEVRDHTGIYHERRGWVSWIRKGSIQGYNSGQRQEQLSHMEDGWKVGESFNAKRAMFAITNGTLFAYTSGDLGIYICPEALKADAFKAFGERKGFSTYVMNEFFHYEGCKDHYWNSPRHLTRLGTAAETICSGMDNSNRGFKGTSPASANLLLFAEHCGGSGGPVKGWEDSKYSIGRNCVLHVPSASPDDSKKASFLGMYHGKSNNPFGMAIFVDGHILSESATTAISSIKNKAYWYCRGKSPENNSN